MQGVGQSRSCRQPALPGALLRNGTRVEFALDPGHSWPQDLAVGPRSQTMFKTFISESCFLYTNNGFWSLARADATNQRSGRSMSQQNIIELLEGPLLDPTRLMNLFDAPAGPFPRAPHRQCLLRDTTDNVCCVTQKTLSAV